MLNNPPKGDITISAVIPLYNESKTLEKVVRIVHSYPHIQEIVAINDGSTDTTLSILKDLEKQLPKLKVIDQQPNRGKTATVVNGIRNAKGKVITMIDGDLLTLKHEHIDKLLEDVLNHKYEMTILDRGGDRNAPLGVASYLITRPLGGERAFWKEEFLKIPLKGTERYGLEVLMNLHYINSNKKIKSIYCPDLETVGQLQKAGSIKKGLKNYQKMAKEIIEVGGVSGYLNQTVNLEEDRLEKLYEVKEKAHNKGGKRALSFIIFGSGILLSIATFIYLASKHSFKNNKVLKKLKS